MRVTKDASKAIDLLRKAIAVRSAHREVRRRMVTHAHSPWRFRIAVYFADSDVNIYQVRQWYRPLQELAAQWPVVVIARNPQGALALLDDAALPVAFCPSVTSLEGFLEAQDIRVVLYVNQNTRNFQMFRYGNRWHVFINHGESDKMYMTTNQFKAYDYALIAGRAARERLTRALWDYDLDRRTIEIGRPQADHFAASLPYDPDDRTVVLYAPTWEGDRPAAHYGSVATHGVNLVTTLLATGDHRVIYRPHPRSGVVNRAFGEANERIISAIRAANEADPAAHHIYDDGPDLGWQLAAADVAIVDISAMVYDRLAVGKPLLVTSPVDPAAEIDEGGYLSACEWLDAEHAAGDVAGVIERVRSDAAASERLAAWSTRYFGDTTPGAATAKFHGAIQTLMDRWDEWNARSGDRAL